MKCVTARNYLSPLFFVLVVLSALFFVSTNNADALFCVNDRERCEKTFPAAFFPRSDNTQGYDTDYKARNAASNWPQISSGGDRYCLGRVCAPFRPRLLQYPVYTGTGERTVGDQTLYYSWGDISFDFRGYESIASSEWGTYRWKADGTFIWDWRDYWNMLNYSPESFEFTNLYPCGFSPTFTTTSNFGINTPDYYAPGTGVALSPFLTARFNLHTNYLHLAPNKMKLCILRIRLTDGTSADYYGFLEGSLPEAPSISKFTVNGEVGDYSSEYAVWVPSGGPVRLDWETDRASYVDPQSSGGDISQSLRDQVKNNTSGYLYNLHPRVNTTYTLTAGNAGGRVSKSVNIKIGKPFVTDFNVYGKIMGTVHVIEGDEVKIEWSVQSTEEVWINGLDDATNNGLTHYNKSGYVFFTPTRTETYQLAIRNREWGWQLSTPITIDVQNPDRARLMQCIGYGMAAAGIAAVSAIPLGVVTANGCALTLAVVGSGIPVAGTIVGAIVGWIGCGAAALIIPAVASGTAVGLACYNNIDYDPRLLQTVLTAPQKPFSLSPPQGPPSLILTDCPLHTCIQGIIVIEEPKHQPAGQPKLVGAIVVGKGGSNVYANGLQTIAQEGSFYKNRDKVFESSIKVEGSSSVNELPKQYMLSNNSAQYILGHCGLSRSCIKNGVKAAIGVDLTNEQFSRMLQPLNIFAGLEL